MKLPNGKYVSLGKIETELKTCSIIDNICVYADPSKPYCVALVAPNETVLIEFAKTLGISGKFAELCSSPGVEQAVLKKLLKHAEQRRLHEFETPTAITLCPDSWSPNSGLVTAAFKIKRTAIQAKYQSEISRMYAT